MKNVQQPHPPFQNNLALTSSTRSYLTFLLSTLPRSCAIPPHLPSLNPSMTAVPYPPHLPSPWPPYGHHSFIRYEFEAVIKCDDDTIINISKLASLLPQYDLSVPFFGGARLPQNDRWPRMEVLRHGR